MIGTVRSLRTGSMGPTGQASPPGPMSPTDAAAYMQLMSLQTHLHFVPAVYAAIVNAVIAATGEASGVSGAGVEAGQPADGFRLG